MKRGKSGVFGIAALALILTAAAVVCELVFFLLQPKPRLRQLSYTAGAFETSEYSRASDGSFEALSNDAYFELTGMGGAAARNIDFFLSREPDDLTEMVVYFSGKSEGVAGRFVAGLQPVSEGVYRAEARFDAIDGMEIYPSEKTGSRILFRGIALNTAVSEPHFSPSRVVLWGYLQAGILSAAALAAAVKKKRTVNLWFSLYWMFGAAAALFAFLSGELFSAARALGDLLIPLLTAAFSVFYLFLYFVAVRVRLLYQKAFWLFLFAGAVFSVATAPLQAPDEGIHFARSYAMAMGSFGFDGAFGYPNDVELLFDSFPGNLKMYETEYGEPSARERMAAYFSRLGQPPVGENKAYSNVFLLLPYIPSAIGVFLGRLFSLPSLFALFIGRFINAAMVAFAAAFALKKAVRYQTALITAAFFPLTVFMAASFSYDAMLLAALFCFFGVISSKVVGRRELFEMAAAFGVIVMIKPLYLLLLPLMFAIPKEALKIRFRRAYPAALSVLLFAGAVFYLLSLAYAGLVSVNTVSPQLLPGVDKSAQTLFILKNPLRFLAVAVVDGFRKSFYAGEYGLFGYLDLAAPLTALLAPAALFMAPVLAAGDRRPGKKQENLLFLSLIVLLYLAVSAAFYIQCSVLGSSTILGIQARYFTPSYFLFAALLSAWLGKLLRPAQNPEKNRLAALFLWFSVALVAGAEVFAGYYL